MLRFITIVLWLICSSSLFAQDTLRIVTYNSLKFPESSAQTRIPYFRTVLRELDPDILVMQELTSQNGVHLLLNDVLNADEPFLYTAAPFVDGYDTDNVLFFKSRSFSIESQRQIKTDLRDISEYVLRIRLNNNMPNIWVYSMHLKAGDDASDVQRRYREAILLRNELALLHPDTNFFVVGDMNFYTNTEPGFVEMTSDQDGSAGRCYDPIDKIGEWHNNKRYTKIHTQSTRTSGLYGGSTGGLDDRFDFILVSKELMTVSDLSCLKDSYQSFGNDGFHFNTNINSGINSAVSDSIADALYHASDHLPVVVDFVWNDPSGVDERGPLDVAVQTTSMPNPFNSRTRIHYTITKSGPVSLDIFNVRGENIVSLVNQQRGVGDYVASWEPVDVPSGVYIVRLKTPSYVTTNRVLYLK